MFDKGEVQWEAYCPPQGAEDAIRVSTESDDWPLAAETAARVFDYHRDEHPGRRTVFLRKVQEGAWRQYVVAAEWIGYYKATEVRDCEEIGPPPPLPTTISRWDRCVERATDGRA